MRRLAPLLFLPALAAAQITATLERFVETRTGDDTTNRLRCELSLSGPDLPDALDYGNPRLTSAIDDQGHPLALADSPESFLPLRIIPGPPPRAVAAITLTAPPRASTTLARLAGSIDLRMYRYQKVRIPDPAAIDVEVKDPLFDAHGFSVRLVHPRHAFPEITGNAATDSLRQRAVCLEITGNAAAVRALELRTATEEPLPTRNVSFGTRQFTLLAAAADQPLPGGFQALVRIPIDPVTRTVPFDLERLTLP